MKLIVCIDEQGGVLFGHRRVSSDRCVISDIMQLIGDSKLYMRQYSADLFGDSEKLQIMVDCLDAPLGAFVFLEESMPDLLWNHVSQVIVYHWNRLYPSDVRFPIDKLWRQGRLVSTVEFAGNSHERITREVYEL